MVRHTYLKKLGKFCATTWLIFAGPVTMLIYILMFTNLYPIVAYLIKNFTEQFWPWFLETVYSWLANIYGGGFCLFMFAHVYLHTTALNRSQWCQDYTLSPTKIIAYSYRKFITSCNFA